MTTRIIDVRSADLFASHYDLAPLADVQWRSVLRSAYAMQSYNASVRGPVTAPRARFMARIRSQRSQRSIASTSAPRANTCPGTPIACFKATSRSQVFSIPATDFAAPRPTCRVW